MNHKFKVGDRVVCVANTLKNKWDVDIIGAAGEVMDVASYPPERYSVMFDGESMVRCMYPQELEKSGPRFKVGDLVRVVGKKSLFVGGHGTIIKELPDSKYLLDFCDSYPYSAENIEYVPKKFEVGEVVKVFHGGKSEIGEVTKIEPSFLWGHKYFVNGAYHADYNMLKVEVTDEVPETEFEVGDIVQIVSDVWYGNEHTGKVARITKVEKKDTITFYQLDIGPGCWFSGELKLVEKA